VCYVAWGCIGCMGVNTMPESLRVHWDALDGEVIWLHGRWKVYRQLFGTSSERVDVLNQTSGTFFNIIQSVLMDSVQLTLSKLAERPRTSGQKNLTLASLIWDVEALGDAALGHALQDLLSAYRRSCAQLIHRRHKQLAHYDRATLLNQVSTPLPGPSRQEIEDALAVLRAFMNTLQRDFTQSETAYDHFVMTYDGDLLLSVLRQGLRYQELVRDGTLSWNDLREHS
jgi:hypothetical protein